MIEAKSRQWLVGAPIKAKQLFPSLTLGLGLTLALLWLLSGSMPPAHADSPHYVAPDCTGVPAPCHTTIQAAVDAAVPGDEILVANGIYTDVNVRPRDDITTTGVVTQVVYISKTVTIRGGYNADFSVWDPDTYSTTLDAQGQGRVLYITGDPSASSGQAISPTIEGLRITGGNTTGMGGDSWGRDAGGGVYVISATAFISNNVVFSNTSGADGGGVYVISATATISNNRVFNNTADYGGGGLCLSNSDATFSDNTVTANTAYHGGGLCLLFSDATLSGNTVISNTGGSRGGGLLLWSSDATLSGNTVASNTTSYIGGGLYLNVSDATLSGNTIISNTAGYIGGGLYLNVSDATLSGNTVTANAATDGGGLYLTGSPATLSGNTVTANAATNGGGLYLAGSPATLTNNVVADNWASTAGSGLYIAYSSPHLLHTTIARNGSTGLTAGSSGDGSGIYIGYSTVALTNTVLVSHTVGITVAVGTAMLDATLWGSGDWANDTDWGGAGTIITGTRNYWDAPAFVAPDAGDYHIGLTSAAIDKGVDAGVGEDIDSDPRPMGHGYDLGADELRVALTVTKKAELDPVQDGAPLTYTIHVTNTGNVTLTATITDTLPERVTPTGTLTWTSVTITPSGIWTEQVVVTVEMDYVGTLTNVVRVTTDEGAIGVYTKTLTSGYEIYLPLIMRQYP